MSKVRKKKHPGRRLYPASRPPLIFTSEVFDSIPVWVEMGARPEEIAAAIGSTVGTLKVRCSQARISLASVRPSIRGGLLPRHWAAVQREADHRKMTVPRLMAEVIMGVAEHDLFAAVLGDYDGAKEVPQCAAR